jgi:Flp pilus assembly protein TadD
VTPYAARLAHAFAHFQAGRLADAERFSRALVQDAPEYAPGWHLLGLVALRSGQSKIAVGLMRRALALHPRDATVLGNLGMALQSTGELADSAVCLERAIALHPEYAEALTNLGNLRLAQGRPDAAAELHRRAIAARPAYAEAHCNLGIALYALLPSDSSEAEASFERALALNPDFAEAHNNLGLILHHRHRTPEALARFRRALALKPGYAEAYNNLGFALEAEGRMAEAGGAYQRVVQLKPDYAEAQNNLGGWHQLRGQRAEAMACFERALALKPDFAIAHYNQALLHLLQGELETGFREYEWRWGFLPRRHFTLPLWRGQPLAGKRILLHAEQGLGDSIQFLRYVPMVAAAGGQVALEVPQPLLRLAQEIPEVSRAIQCGEALPEYDWQCPLMSLPLAFRTRLDTIPAQVPYLRIPVAARRKADRLNWRGTAPRVGLVWAGSPKHKKDRDRSIPSRLLDGLSKAAGVEFCSLQVGDEASQANALGIQALAPHIEDLADTAALLERLDLLISVDTAVAHLAGALGIPAWVLLPFAPDWRWLLERADSPWYPSIRVFRQPRPGDWASVLDEVHQELPGQLARSARFAHPPPDGDSA